MKSVGEEAQGRKKIRIRTIQQWDELCKQAVSLREQGLSYEKIAQKLGCTRSILCDHLKTRGLWKTNLTSKEKWDELCKQALWLEKEGMSYKEIAKELSCSVESVRTNLKKRGLWKGFSTEQIQENTRKKWDELCKKTVVLQAKGLSYYAIAKKLNCDDCCLVRELKKRGLWQEKTYINAQQKWDELCKQAMILRKQGLTYKLIAQKLNCGVGCLHIELKKRGLKKQVRSQDSLLRKKWDEVCAQAVALHEQGMGYLEIAKDLNCHVTTLRKELKKRGVWKNLSAEQLRMQRVENARKRWDELCKQAVILHEQGIGYTVIAQKLGCSRPKLEIELEKRGLWMGISMEQRKKDSRKKWDKLCKKAVSMYEEGMSYKQIAKRLDCSDSVLVKELIKRKIRRGESAEQIHANARKKWDELCKKAVILRGQEMIYKEIATELGCQEPNLIRELKKRGLYRKFHKDISQEDYT
ncbi:hypothetical protein [Bacillus cereus]|uniref:hypothetical protein n=1 Tax=Bacillus cereus TaxID=1396 RepID=UPI003012AA87